ncbi:MAG: DUF3604 domain-containing protein, partial [Desulfobulbaceae bacterium]
MIRALRDVDGANLDRVQIVKGWLNSTGALQEKVYDVMCYDNRSINSKGLCDKPVGNTVDITTTTYTNSIGEALMLAYIKKRSKSNPSPFIKELAKEKRIIELSNDTNGWILVDHKNYY